MKILSPVHTISTLFPPSDNLKDAPIMAIAVKMILSYTPDVYGVFGLLRRTSGPL